MLDEKMRFMNCENGSKLPGTSILDIGVTAALASAGFNETGKIDLSHLITFGLHRPCAQLSSNVVGFTTTKRTRRVPTTGSSPLFMKCPHGPQDSGSH